MRSRSRPLKDSLSLLLFLTATACNSPVHFSNDNNLMSQALNPAMNSPVAPGAYEKLQGLCAADSSTTVLGSLKCEVPTSLPPLSRKAQELLTTMTKACQIANKSDPSGYLPPTGAELLQRLNQCSSKLYPDTAFTGTQASTISGLTAASDGTRAKIFSGIFYTLPWAEDFATYFGLEVVEARYLFCYRTGSLPPNIYPIEYYQSQDSFNFRMPPAYVEANQIRSGLISCMQESQTHTYVPPGPAYHCSYETLKGLNGATIFNQAATWLQQGSKVSFDSPSNGISGPVTSISDIKNLKGDIQIGTYSCQRN
jgi:hypothetical protein